MAAPETEVTPPPAPPAPATKGTTTPRTRPLHDRSGGGRVGRSSSSTSVMKTPTSLLEDVEAEAQAKRDQGKKFDTFEAMFSILDDLKEEDNTLEVISEYEKQQDVVLQLEKTLSDEVGAITSILIQALIGSKSVLEEMEKMTSEAGHLQHVIHHSLQGAAEIGLVPPESVRAGRLRERLQKSSTLLSSEVQNLDRMRAYQETLTQTLGEQELAMMDMLKKAVVAVDSSKASKYELRRTVEKMRQGHFRVTASRMYRGSMKLALVGWARYNWAKKLALRSEHFVRRIGALRRWVEAAREIKTERGLDSKALNSHKGRIRQVARQVFASWRKQSSRAKWAGKQEAMFRNKTARQQLSTGFLAFKQLLSSSRSQNQRSRQILARVAGRQLATVWRFWHKLSAEGAQRKKVLKWAMSKAARLKTNVAFTQWRSRAKEQKHARESVGVMPVNQATLLLRMIEKWREYSELKYHKSRQVGLALSHALGYPMRTGFRRWVEAVWQRGRQLSRAHRQLSPEVGAVRCLKEWSHFSLNKRRRDAVRGQVVRLMRKRGLHRVLEEWSNRASSQRERSVREERVVGELAARSRTIHLTAALRQWKLTLKDSLNKQHQQHTTAMMVHHRRKTLRTFSQWRSEAVDGRMERGQERRAQIARSRCLLRRGIAAWADWTVDQALNHKLEWRAQEKRRWTLLQCCVASWMIRMDVVRLREHQKRWCAKLMRMSRQRLYFSRWRRRVSSARLKYHTMDVTSRRFKARWQRRLLTITWKVWWGDIVVERGHRWDLRRGCELHMDKWRRRRLLHSWGRVAKKEVAEREGRVREKEGRRAVMLSAIFQYWRRQVAERQAADLAAVEREEKTFRVNLLLPLLLTTEAALHDHNLSKKTKFDMMRDVGKKARPTPEEIKSLVKSIRAVDEGERKCEDRELRMMEEVGITMLCTELRWLQAQVASARTVIMKERRDMRQKHADEKQRAQQELMDKMKKEQYKPGAPLVVDPYNNLHPEGANDPPRPQTVNGNVLRDSYPPVNINPSDVRIPTQAPLPNYQAGVNAQDKPWKVKQGEREVERAMIKVKIKDRSGPWTDSTGSPKKFYEDHPGFQDAVSVNSRHPYDHKEDRHVSSPGSPTTMGPKGSVVRKSTSSRQLRPTPPETRNSIQRPHSSMVHDRTVDKTNSASVARINQSFDLPGKGPSSVSQEKWCNTRQKSENVPQPPPSYPRTTGPRPNTAPSPMVPKPVRGAGGIRRQTTIVPIKE